MSKQLSIGEAAKHLGISRDTLRRWEKKGKITPSRSPSNRRYYTKEQLDTLIKKPKTAKKTAPTPPSALSSESLKLVIYALLAVVTAAILALVAQIYFF
jgi:excisionase family DNA binding protein